MITIIWINNSYPLQHKEAVAPPSFNVSPPKCGFSVRDWTCELKHSSFRHETSEKWQSARNAGSEAKSTQSPVRFHLKPHTFHDEFRPSVHTKTLSVCGETASLWKHSRKWIQMKRTGVVFGDGRARRPHQCIISAFFFANTSIIQEK